MRHELLGYLSRGKGVLNDYASRTFHLAVVPKSENETAVKYPPRGIVLVNSPSLLGTGPGEGGRRVGGGEPCKSWRSSKFLCIWSI